MRTNVRLVAIGWTHPGGVADCPKGIILAFVQEGRFETEVHGL